MNVGTFIVYCHAYMEGDYKDPGLARHMTLSSYKGMDEDNRLWARANHPKCVPN